jgi:hypothetical protein
MSTLNRRAQQHITQLLHIVAQCPSSNPSADSDVDVPQLLGQARSRYKALCARLGVRPSLRVSQASGSTSGGSGETHDKCQADAEGPSQRSRVWAVERDAKAPDLSF